MIFHTSRGANKSSGLSRYFLGIFFFLGLTLMISGTCQAYVMPAEQIIQFMSASFVTLKTVVLTQFVQQIRETSGEDFGIPEISVIKEQIWMSSPDFYRSRVLDENTTRRFWPDLTYRQLLISNSPEKLTALLSGMGIDLEQVAFTRIEGTIAYRIGDSDPAGAKILIDKERFLPLFLQYRSSRQPEEKVISVAFRDYQQVEEGWYPFEIAYSSNFTTNEVYTVIQIIPNVPIDPSILSSPEPGIETGDKGEAKQSLSDEERLREVIRKIEEKYR